MSAGCTSTCLCEPSGVHAVHPPRYPVVSRSWPKAIVLAVWGAAVVSSVDHFLRPKLVAGRVRLSGLAMFVGRL